MKATSTVVAAAVSKRGADDSQHGLHKACQGDQEHRADDPQGRAEKQEQKQ